MLANTEKTHMHGPEKVKDKRRETLTVSRDNSESQSLLQLYVLVLYVLDLY